MEPRQIQRYGWKRDTPDPRDRLFNLEERIEQGAVLPAKFSLRNEMPPVYDQGQLGSCTAQADAAVFEHQAMRQKETSGTPSRLFVYYEERRLEGSPLDQDTGAEVRTGIKVLASEGAPPESEVPYDIARFADRPSPQAYKDALKHEAVAYKRIVIGTPGAPMRTALAVNHLPIVFGFPVPEVFELFDPTQQALGLPISSSQFIGGHAVVVVGYDFSLKRFKMPVFEVRNSWSDAWGDAGHFFIDSRWFDTWRNLAADLWCVSKVS